MGLLWVTVMCQCRFINYNKCTMLVGNIDDGGHDMSSVGQGYVRNHYTFCSILL